MPAEVGRRRKYCHARRTTIGKGRLTSIWQCWNWTSINSGSYLWSRSWICRNMLLCPSAWDKIKKCRLQKVWVTFHFSRTSYIKPLRAISQTSSRSWGCCVFSDSKDPETRLYALSGSVAFLVTETIWKLKKWRHSQVTTRILEKSTASRNFAKHFCYRHLLSSRTNGYCNAKFTSWMTPDFSILISVVFKGQKSANSKISVLEINSVFYVWNPIRQNGNGLL